MILSPKEFNLKNLLKRNRIRNIDLARYLGVSKQHVQFWVEGKKISRAYQRLIAEFFSSVEEAKKHQKNLEEPTTL